MTEEVKVSASRGIEMNNELRLAASNFRNAMTAVCVARNRLAEAVAAEADAPNAHERTREERDALLQLRSRLRGGELPDILAGTKLIPNLEGEK
jgi:hypothetical protein